MGGRALPPARQRVAQDLLTLPRARAADVDRRLDQRHVHEVSVRLRHQRAGRHPRRRPGCATCHTGPGTGAWGANHELATAGSSRTVPGSVAATTCIACHSTQVPAQVVMSFDRQERRGRLLRCHQATVMAGKYVNYSAPARDVAGGDWQGGQDIPGARCCPRAARRQSPSPGDHRARAHGQRPRHRHDIQPAHADERHRAHVDGD